MQRGYKEKLKKFKEILKKGLTEIGEACYIISCRHEATQTKQNLLSK